MFEWRPARLIVLALALSGAPASASGNDDTARLHGAHADLLARTGQRAEALSVLWRHDIDTPLHAMLLAERGLTGQAAARLDSHGSDPAAADAWLALARAQYRNGEPAAAENALLRMSRNLSPATANARASLLGRVLLRQGRFDEAALALAGQRRRDGAMTPIDRFNLGVAWLRAGATEQGAAELTALGRYDGDDPARRLLADHANLKLGYWFLRDGRGRLARRVLQRIRLDGPFTRQATLALGWAELAPAGESQRLVGESARECREPAPELWSEASDIHRVPRIECDGVQTEEDAITAAEPRASKAAALRRAAVAWRETASASALRPAVQEALVALPYALKQAGDREQAWQAYQTAIERLEAARERLDRGEAPAPPSLRLTRGNRLRAWRRDLEALDEDLGRMQEWLRSAPTTAEVDRASVERLRELLDELRAAAPAGREVATPQGAQRARLQSLTRDLEALSTRERDYSARIEDLRERLGAVRETVRALTSDVAAARSDHRDAQREQLRRRIDRYLAEARLGLASLMD